MRIEHKIRTIRCNNPNCFNDFDGHAGMAFSVVKRQAAEAGWLIDKGPAETAVDYCGTECRDQHKGRDAAS